MNMKVSGSRQLPMRHLSIRVPWNDTGWQGCVCQRPSDNISCLILPRIRETKDDQLEEKLAGFSWKDLEQDQLPACATERGSFMAPYDFSRAINHPYAETSSAHSHFQAAEYRYPAYSAACIPFKWMLKDSAMEKAEQLELGLQQEVEDQARDIMNFDSAWLQDKQNQLVMLDTFFSAVKPKESLVFFYAKRTPLLEDHRRVIIGVGWVEDLGETVEYNYTNPGDLKSVIWERPVYHSIRPEYEDGFIFPYHEIIEYLEENPDQDPTKFTAFAPDEHFWSYSYASEHITNDGAIASLLSCLKAIQNIKKAIPGEWEEVQVWIEERLNEIWKMRGPCPGLGSALQAFGFQHGILLAYELEKLLAERKQLDPWPLIEDLFSNRNNYPVQINKHVTDSLKAKWSHLPGKRKQLLKLLSRFELSPDQAACFYVHEDSRREKYIIGVSDDELLENPYLLYELDRLSLDPIDLSLIDRGLFPEQHQRESYPLPNQSRISDPTDPRRVRAFVVSQLEKMAGDGHTLAARTRVIQEIRSMEVKPDCPVDGDLMNVVEDSFSPFVRSAEIDDESRAYQLERFAETRRIISTAVARRIRGRRHEEEIDWRYRLDERFPDQELDEAEEQARLEKTKALEELYASRFSVLLGKAGTGKTTLLEILLNHPEVQKGGVTILAPTGKARVRLESQTKISGGKTIAQFLVPLDRYETTTQRYRLSDQEPEKSAQTVVIDEASMLTEEQLAATLDALAGVERLILVGDHKQLPPIGAGRPFLDIVQYLAPKGIEGKVPKVDQGYAELTINRRQMIKDQAERDDLLLAEWFSGRPLDPGADEIWAKIDSGHSSCLRFIQWESSEELRNLLLTLVVEELGLDGIDDYQGFEISLGGRQHGEWVYFNNQYGNNPGASSKIEDWQILSPVRNAPHGVEALNRLIQETFRWKTKQSAKVSPDRKVPRPMGREGILYGDKVINVKNDRRYDVYPREDALRYVANGEIGVVVGQLKRKNSYFRGLPKKLEVEFSSQPGFKYGFQGSDFSSENESHLELAYALTVHKSQGSEFGLTILIIPEECRILSRELLYTGLTRQKDKVIIFHQGDRHHLKKYASEKYSEIARRMTNLFDHPKPVQIADSFLEAGLIHRTVRGEGVRSKSEVIIAGIFDRLDLDYSYEAPLIGKDGSHRYPDFTVIDDETGNTYFIEHLGMLNNPVYRRRWKRKLAWYRQHGILPSDEGGGPEGTLITTRDDERGGIQEDKIEQKIRKIMLL